MDDRLPNLIVIGAAKSGTSSLHYYLGLHPEIAMTREKELNFFTTKGRWHEGLEWYRSRFRPGTTVRGESSPSYTQFPGDKAVPERMHAIVPEARLVYVVRDPVERIVSHYVHACSEGKEGRSLDEALADPERSGYVWTSRYAAQLERYLPYFPMDRILVLDHAELLNRRTEVLPAVFRFLGVDESFSSPKFSAVRNESRDLRRKNRAGALLERHGMDWLLRRIPAGWGRRSVAGIVYRPFSRLVERPVVSEALGVKLADALRDDARRLRELTGRAFASWSV